MPARLVRRGRHERRHGGRLALAVHRDHGEEAAVGVPQGLRLDVLGHHLDADFHRGGAGVVHAGEEGHQLAHVDGLAEHHLVHRQRDHVAPAVPARARIRHLVEQLQDRAAVHVAREVGHVRRHQHRHGQLVVRQVHSARLDDAAGDARARVAGGLGLVVVGTGMHDDAAAHHRR